MVSVLLFLTKASLRPVQMVTNRNNNNKKISIILTHVPLPNASPKFLTASADCGVPTQKVLTEPLVNEDFFYHLTPIC